MLNISPTCINTVSVRSLGPGREIAREDSILVRLELKRSTTPRCCPGCRGGILTGSLSELGPGRKGWMLGVGSVRTREGDLGVI